ncbi:MAG: lipopolysaccharide heptosyltransferase I [Chloracidobacterium sp.]|nr:lipopolysaccharide heptosyltransferase I [Chloracidobacterium sp.]
MRILIVKLSAIGDIVHALPAVAAIRANLPDAEISWVVEQRSAEIVRGSSVVDHLIEIDTRSMRGGKVIDEILLDMTKQAKLIRQRKYDIAIDFQGLIKSAVIAKISGAKRRWGFSRLGLREPAGRFLLTDTVKTPDKCHVIRKNLHLAAGALDFAYDDTRLEFPIATTDEHRAEADAILSQMGERFAILNPGGGWVTKLWHAEKFGQLADRIYDETGMTSLVATGPAESELAERVAAASRTGRLTLAEPSLRGFYEIARRAAVYVGGDTGPTHIAIAAGAPTVGIFGPTEWWRNGSLAAGDICVSREDIDCRVDCHRRTCDKWICMDISVETVFNAVRQRIGT